MKIEIEFGEVEILRDTIFKQEEEIKQLKEQLSLLDEKSLQDKAISLSFHLFETYIAAVFQRLGLEPMHGESVRIPDSLNHYLGTEWWRRGRLEITLGANVTSRFKKAFLNLGIIFKEDMPNEVNFENDPPKVVSVVYEPKEKTLEERMYSEEEVIRILDKREDYLGTEPSIFDYLTNEEWFQLFKIK